MKYTFLAALTRLSLSTGASYAVDGFKCPNGSTQVSTGAYSTPSCVGSNSQGLVEQTLPFSNYNYLGAETPRETNRIFALPERAPVKDSPVYPRPIGGIAANDTFSSARDSLLDGIPSKLLADWVFLYEGPRAVPGSRLAWMGGVLWRKPDASLLFSPDAADAKSDLWIPMTPYRRDIRGFRRPDSALVRRAVWHRHRRISRRAAGQRSPLGRGNEFSKLPWGNRPAWRPASRRRLCNACLWLQRLSIPRYRPAWRTHGNRAILFLCAIHIHHWTRNCLYALRNCK